MPGKVASRAPRSSAASRKTASARSSAEHSPAADIPDEGPVTALRKQIATVFSDAQKSTAGHRKLVINLRKIQEACCYEPQNLKKKRQEEEYDEDDFNNEVVRCMLRVLAIKKSEPAGNRILQFLCLFLRVASEKDNQLQNGDADMSEISETFTARLINVIFSTLLQLLTIKDKIIRFRATQFIAQFINTLDALDDNMFQLLRLGLLKRIYDKESAVRQYAVYGLGRLAAEVDDEEEADDSDDSNANGNGILEKLLDVLQNDPSAEVRRTLLCNLPFTPATLPYLLERARDLDGATRRALYSRLLPALGDFRHLSLTHREKLLRWGLRDRDENVRKATARLFRERWIEDCAALPGASSPDEEDGGAKKQPNEAAAPSLDALLELLERIDVTNSGVEGGIALEAMKEFWDGRPDYRDYVEFDDAYWTELGSESVFVARTFNDYCRSKGEEDGRLIELLETKMPEVTKFGFLLERQIQELVAVVTAVATEGADPDGELDLEEQSVQREFIVEQMLYMALTFDYSDEVGRRKMFGVMREALAMPELPEEATKLVVEVLRLVCGDDNNGKGEREFCGVVLEAIAEVHDTIMGEEPDQSEDVEDSFHSARSELSDRSQSKPRKGKKRDEDEDEEMDEEKAIREIMVNMKCLHIAQCMLQNVQCDLEENVHLVTMLNNLVVPAVRSQEAPIRERGLVCLGLCCLLGKNLAQENLTLFLHCFAKGHAALQTIALQIMTDILTTHPSLLAPVLSSGDGDATQTSLTEPSPLLKPVLKAYAKSLKSSDAGVQSTGALALSKLMLGQLITDTDLLKNLVIAFFDPETTGNASLRQALTYFLPVYCHSRVENAERMVEVATSVIAKLATLREAFIEDEDADEGEMVTLTVIGGLLVDWTDPRKIVGADNPDKMRKQIEEGASGAEGQTHLQMAEQILERLVTSQTTKDERKVLFSMLSKLHIQISSPDPTLLRIVLELVSEATETRVASDATSRNGLTKLQTTLLKLMHDVATAERGGGGEEETVLDETVVPPTPAPERPSRQQPVYESDVDMMDVDEDDATMQIKREMEATRLEDPDNEGTVLEDTVVGADASVMEDFDTSNLADDKAVQELLESFDASDDDL